MADGKNAATFFVKGLNLILSVLLNCTIAHLPGGYPHPTIRQSED